jgi:hypothetical protein
VMFGNVLPFYILMVFTILSFLLMRKRNLFGFILLLSNMVYSMCLTSFKFSLNDNFLAKLNLFKLIGVENIAN